MEARETSPGASDRGARLTVEIESILVNEELAVLFEAAEASGQLRQVDLVELLDPLELDLLELEAVYTELDRRAIELVIESEKEDAPQAPPAVTAPVETTTDALQLFMREAGKHPLDFMLEVVGRRVVRERELEQPSHMHRRVARLEHEPNGIEWGNLPHRLCSAPRGRVIQRKA